MAPLKRWGGGRGFRRGLLPADGVREPQRLPWQRGGTPARPGVPDDPALATLVRGPPALALECPPRCAVGAARRAVYGAVMPDGIAGRPDSARREGAACSREVSRGKEGACGRLVWEGWSH